MVLLITEKEIKMKKRTYGLKFGFSDYPISRRFKTLVAAQWMQEQIYKSGNHAIDVIAWDNDDWDILTCDEFEELERIWHENFK